MYVLRYKNNANVISQLLLQSRSFVLKTQWSEDENNTKLFNTTYTCAVERENISNDWK